MSIQAINSASLINNLTLSAEKNVTEDSFVSFKELLDNVVGQVSETDQVVKQDEIRVATGQSDDLHTVTMNLAKADLALYTLVQVRNKALDAYNEIMRITL